MASGSKTNAKSASDWLYSSRLHVVLYASLLVATPFVLLQSFTVDAVGKASRSTFTLGNIELPIVGTAVVLVAIIALLAARKHLTRYRIAAGLIAILMIALAQQITDFYFDHKFYDLQQNWHYGAYGIFAYMMHRDLTPRGWPLHRIILTTYLVALSLSTFDEAFQMLLSSRVFDTCDIAKDVWGVLIGIIVVHLGGKEPEKLMKSWRQTCRLKLSDCFRHPITLSIHVFVLSFILLSVSSLLSEVNYWHVVVLLTLGLFTVYLIAFRITRNRWGRYAVISILVLTIVAQGYSFIRYQSRNIVHDSYGLTIYKGIPIPFFDLMIYPDGTFRLVDKKHYFNLRDQDFFLKQKTDILLIGSGESGLSGEGFPERTACQFIYNKYLKKGTQLLILKTSEACETFNRLKREGKNVLFVLHNTC